jgi:peptide/nickel transport system permease protein
MATLSGTLARPRALGVRLEALRGLPVVPGLILLALFLTALLADVLAPYDPTVPVAGARIFQPPFWMTGGTTSAVLGTDFQGRDVLGRLIFGARVSLLVGLTGTAVAGGIGLVLGILAGYLGGWVDQVVMRVTDAWLALPFLMFAIFLAALLGPGVWNIVIVFGFVYWTRYARVIRGEVLTLREREFVRLAQVAGVSAPRIILRHIVPNVLNTWMVLASLTVGVVIVTEASLSFLGVGVPPPTPAWGLMLAEARSTLMAGQWWLTVFPGACISVVVLPANFYGDWLSVRLDPQRRDL